MPRWARIVFLFLATPLLAAEPPVEFNQWIGLHKFWPRPNTTDLEEIHWRDFIEEEGGRTIVYQRILTGPNQELPLIRVFIRPQELINAWLKKNMVWPLQSATGVPEDLEKRLEHYLARWVEKKGGKSVVEKKYLTPLNRLRLSVDKETRRLLEEDPIQLVDKWIAEKKDWPKTKDDGSLEDWLAKYIGIKGGRKRIFPNLSPENQKIPGLNEHRNPPTTLEDFKTDLNTWIATNKVWPGAHSSNKEEKALGIGVNARGGQNEVFENLLAEENKRLPLVRINVFPEEVLRDWISQNKRWPVKVKGGAGSKDLAARLEFRLSGLVQTFGGQEMVFREILSSPLRKLPFIRIKVEPLALLEEWIREQQRWTGRTGDDLERALDSWVNRNGGKKKVFPRLSLQTQSIINASLKGECRRLFKLSSSEEPSPPPPQ